MQCGTAPPGLGPGRALEGLTGPLAVILNAREGSASQRNEEAMQWLSTSMGDKFAHTRISSPKSAPLNWRLTAEQAALIRSGAEEEEPAGVMDAVAAWIDARW